MAVLRLDIGTGSRALFHPAGDVSCFPIPQPNPVLHYTGKTDRWDFLTSEPTESGSNIASVCYPRSFISFQLIKPFCGSPAHMPLSWSRTCCSFSSFAIRPSGTPMKTGKSRQRAWNSNTVLSDTEDKESFGGEAAVDEHQRWGAVAAVKVAVACKVRWLLKERDSGFFPHLMLRFFAESQIWF